jgi:hypothetical protein
MDTARKKASRVRPKPATAHTEATAQAALGIGRTREASDVLQQLALLMGSVETIFVDFADTLPAYRESRDE